MPAAPGWRGTPPLPCLVIGVPLLVQTSLGTVERRRARGRRASTETAHCCAEHTPAFARTALLIAPSVPASSTQGRGMKSIQLPLQGHQQLPRVPGPLASASYLVQSCSSVRVDCQACGLPRRAASCPPLHEPAPWPSPRGLHLPRCSPG